MGEVVLMISDFRQMADGLAAVFVKGPPAELARDAVRAVKYITTLSVANLAVLWAGAMIKVPLGHGQLEITVFWQITRATRSAHH